MENLTKGGYRGDIYPVNPGEGEVFGRRAYPSLRDLPAQVDLALILVPAERVPAIMAEGRGKVKGAVIISGGFAEAGPDGQHLQEDLMAAAGKAGIRIIGPNCMGLYNCNIGLNASLSLGTPERGGTISLITQSGAYGMAIYTMAQEHAMRFAKVVSLGNKCDVDETEVLAYLGDDPETGVICMLMEGVSRGREFLGCLRAITARKPVIILKTGRSEGARRAVLSHTASLAGEASVYQVAFRQGGALAVRDGLEMLDVARALAFQPLPAGRGVGIVTNSGGVGVELTDLIEEEGLTVLELPPDLQASLGAALPSYASPRNPIDITPLWGRFPELYSLSIEHLFACPDVDIIVPILLQRASLMKEVAEAVQEAVQRGQARWPKPVYVCWVGPRDSLANMALLEEAGIPCYEWPARCARVAAQAAAYSRTRLETTLAVGAAP